MMKHMKKIIIGILVVLIGLTSALVLAACNGDTYGGKYTEVTDKAKIEQSMKNLENAMSNIEEWAGLKINLDFKIITKGSIAGQAIDETVTISGNAHLVFDMEQLSLEFNTKSGSENTETKAYIKDGAIYLYTNVNGKTEKIKLELYDDLDPSVILDLISGISGDIDLSGIDLSGFDIDDLNIDSILSKNSLKIYTTAETGARNIKFAIENLNFLFFNDSDISLILALDANDNIKGIKAELNLSIAGSGITTDIIGSITVEPFTNGINFPNDLDSYTAK